VKHLELRGIRKEFGGVPANDGIDLSVRSGEIAALLGENGAGKTTLMNILYGLYRPDAGEILVDGRPAAIRSPKDAIRLGIGMVHQHFLLIGRHTAAENVALGLEGVPFVRPERWAARRMEEFAARYGLRVRPEAPVWLLSAGQQQRLELIKALIRGARLLILDEPTSVLTDAEADELFAVLRRMTAEGMSVIFITHKLEEVMRLSHAITVLRRGRVAGTASTAETTPEALASLMTGLEPVAPAARAQRAPGPEVLRVEGLTVAGDMGVPAVSELAFSVRSGEVLGVAGVSGNGQSELAEALTGLRRPERGSIRISGTEAAGRDCRALRALGVRHVPEERPRFGVVGDMSVAENAVLTRYHEPPFCRRGMLDAAEMRRRAESLIACYGIRPPSPEARAGTLSGGNIQKLILGREADGKPALIVAVHPTYGLDVGATEFVRERLLEKRAEGAAVLLISEDLEEVLRLSDRVAVMFEGRFLDVRENRGLDRRELMLLMGGGQPA